MSETQNPLKICFVASEVAPFAKTGGLADVAGALPPDMARRGHDVRIFMPLHAQIDVSRYDLTPVDFLRNVTIDLGPHRFTFSVYTTKLRGATEGGGDADLYLINCPQLFHRGGVYTGEWDEHLRFALLSKGALVCCQYMGWGPDIIHCNDWHTALVPLYLKTTFAWDRGIFGGTKSVLTIHNIAYQGIFPADVVANLDLDRYRGFLHQEDLGRGMVNFLKTGILYADVITTVSRTYAREIQTEAFGEGLEALLRERRGSVLGIVNGVDYDTWNPASDPHLPHNYDAETVAEGKEANKKALLEEMHLPYRAGVPTLGIVSRLTAQKGFDLTFEPLPEALRYLDIRLVILGSGESRYEEHFHWLQRTFPQKVCYYRGYNEPLAHWIEAAADIFLMPSRFEPCGLNQMYSLRYGTAPLVRATGGLADTVEPWRANARQGNGFVFDHFDSTGFAWGLKQALTAYRDAEGWAVLRRNGMAKDYSWERQGGEYEKLYTALCR